MIGQRLEKSREAADLSHEKLANRTKGRVTAKTILRYEGGKIPGSGDLIILAGALDVPVSYLLNDTDMRVEFRKNDPADPAQVKRQEIHIKHLMENYLSLEDILGVSGAEWDRPPDIPYVVRDISDAERAAERLRSHWGLDTNPIHNVTGLLEDHGIKVLLMDAGNVDGAAVTASLPGKKDVFAIAISGDIWGERQRFAACRELGHILLEASPDSERAAYRFAGAFLIPKATLVEKIGDTRAVSMDLLRRLKGHFGASMQAIAYRCRDLQIIDEATSRGLFDEFESRGWRSPPYKEPGAIHVEKPRRLGGLVRRALDADAITKSKAAELLNVKVDRLFECLKEDDLPKTIP